MHSRKENCHQEIECRVRVRKLQICRLEGELHCQDRQQEILASPSQPDLQRHQIFRHGRLNSH